MRYEDLNLSEKELDELQEQLNMRKKKKAYEDNISTIIDNKKYIGKCFKEKDKEKYIRVISAKSSNQYRLECICFEFPIDYKEQHRMTKIFNPDNAFSTIDFQGIYVEDYPLLCSWFKGKGLVINSLEEITEDEYFDKMRVYIEQLEILLKGDYFDTSKNVKKN